MTNEQRAQLRLSEARKRLAEIAAVDEPDEKQVEERSKLLASIPGLEEQSQAAIQGGLLSDTETETQTAEKRVLDGGEDREIRSLLGKASVGNFILSAAEHRALDGAEAELSSALKMGANMIPLQLLVEPAENDGETEHRAAVVPPADADKEQMRRAWIGRLFAGSALEALAVRTVSVPAGEPMWTSMMSGGRSRALCEGCHCARSHFHLGDQAD